METQVSVLVMTNRDNAIPKEKIYCYEGLQNLKSYIEYMKTKGFYVFSFEYETIKVVS